MKVFWQVFGAILAAVAVIAVIVVVVVSAGHSRTNSRCATLADERANVFGSQPTELSPDDQAWYEEHC